MNLHQPVKFQSRLTLIVLVKENKIKVNRVCFMYIYILLGFLWYNSQ